MKLSFTPIAATVAVALAATAAHAQLGPPSQAIGTAPTVDSLYVAVWDTATNVSEFVNLGYNLSQLTAAGALTPNSSADANAVNYAVAANPIGTAGNVLQLNFGTINGWSTNFPTPSSTTSWLVAATNGSSTAQDLFTYADPANAIASTLTRSALTTQSTNMAVVSNTWATGPVPSGTNPGIWLDSNCSTSICAIQPAGSAGMNTGTFGLTAFNFSNTVGSAMQFFSLADVAGSRTAVTESQFANTTGAGFWYLSTSGDLTWNVPTAAAAVPLPAAGWLLVSGLLGLGAIRRRRAAP